MSTLSSRLQAAKQQSEVEARIAAKLASGKFIDTGAKYTPEQATADHSNPTLRMTASVDASGKLEWK